MMDHIGEEIISQNKAAGLKEVVLLFYKRGKAGISLMTVCLKLLQSMKTVKLPEDKQLF